MERRKYFSMTLWVGVIALTGMSLLYMSCNHQQEKANFEKQLDECLPGALQRQNEFDNPEDAILYQHECLHRESHDSIFLSLSDQQIANIASILLKHQQRISVSDIVYEYVKNKSIYDTKF